MTALPLLDDLSDHLSAVSAAESASSDVGSQAGSAGGTAETPEAARSNEHTGSGETARPSGRGEKSEACFGLESVHSRGGLRIVKEVRMISKADSTVSCYFL